MTRFRLEISEASVADILEQADWYASRASEDIAAKWERAVTATVLHILECPHAGLVTFSEIRNWPIFDVLRLTISRAI